MRVLILGGSGMLGHRLWLGLSAAHETWVSLRSDDAVRRHPAFDLSRACLPVDVRQPDDVARALATVRPHCVINCVGLIKQLPAAREPLLSIEINALLPHRLAHLCAAAGARLIHISTDCVFSGARGNYRETDTADAGDLYGRTKLLGEVAYPHALTLRTSVIGRELKRPVGLIEWLLASSGPITGYRRVVYSGLTTAELARVIDEHVLPNPALAGLYHVASEPITKYELLKLAANVFGRPSEIMPVDEPICDRSLNGTRFQQATGYRAPAWAEMIQTLTESSELYDHR